MSGVLSGITKVIILSRQAFQSFDIPTLFDSAGFWGNLGPTQAIVVTPNFPLLTVTYHLNNSTIKSVELFHLPINNAIYNDDLWDRLVMLITFSNNTPDSFGTRLEALQGKLLLDRAIFCMSDSRGPPDSPVDATWGDPKTALAHWLAKKWYQ